jgi:RHS repeat-associated protein
MAMVTRPLATALLALALAAGWPATPAEAYGGTTTLTYDEQLTGYAATWRDPWDPYYQEECYWWEEDPWTGEWYCVAWYEWENFAHISNGLYTPSGTWVAGSGATHWDHAQVDLTPLTPTEYGTWNHYGDHYQFQQEWHFDGWQWHYNEYYYYLGGTGAPAYVPPPPTPPWISSLNPDGGPVGTVVTISGSDFGTTWGTASFHGTPATVLSWTPTSIDAQVPQGATTGPVVVVTAPSEGGLSSNTDRIFTVQPSGPPPDEVFYYHLDAIGSVRMITDADQQVVRRCDYLPFGQEWQCTGVDDPRGFAEMERAPETGGGSWLPLNYAGARYYHSQAGRFTSPDPVWVLDQHLEDPQTWNRYVYVRNNPFRYTDADGRSIKGVTLAFKVARAVYKGHDVYSTVEGIVDAATLIASPDSSGGERAIGVLLMAAELSGVTDLYKVGRETLHVVRPTRTDRLKEQLFERPGKPRSATTLAAARSERAERARGVVVSEFDHITKVQNAQRGGLLRRIDEIKRQLARSDLDSNVRAALLAELGEASRLLDYSELFVPR